MPLSWEPSRLSCELLKAQWQWPVCGSSPSRLFRPCQISACLFSAPHCASYRLARSLAIPSTARFFPLCHVSLPQFRRKSRRAGWFRELCLTHATSVKNKTPSSRMRTEKLRTSRELTTKDTKLHEESRSYLRVPSCPLWFRNFLAQPVSSSATPCQLLC